MGRQWKMTVFLAGLIFVSPALALAQGNSQGHGKGHHKDDDDEDRQEYADRGNHTGIAFSQHDRVVIEGWFHERSERNDLPPGLAKRDRLPPGLEKQLRERGTLPPGLQKKVQPLPDDLDRQLPPLPEGYRRAVIGGNVIIVNQKTQMVFSILRGIVP